MTVNELIEHLKKNYKADDEIAHSIWSHEDIAWVGKDYYGMPISEDESADILASIDHNHDANIGICWDVIHYYVAELHQQKARPQ